MQQLEERTYQYNGRTFVIKRFGTSSGFAVVSFLDGLQVSPSYSISFETHADYFMQHQQSLIENLFSIAQSDLEGEMYFRA